MFGLGFVVGLVVGVLLVGSVTFLIVDVRGDRKGRSVKMAFPDPVVRVDSRPMSEPAPESIRRVMGVKDDVKPCGGTGV